MVRYIYSLQFNMLHLSYQQYSTVRLTDKCSSCFFPGFPEKAPNRDRCIDKWLSAGVWTKHGVNQSGLELYMKSLKQVMRCEKINQCPVGIHSSHGPTHTKILTITHMHTHRNIHSNSIIHFKYISVVCFLWRFMHCNTFLSSRFHS